MNKQKLEELAIQLELTSPPHNLQGVLSELKDIRVKLHPDQNGGEHKSEKEKNLYHEVNDAIEYINSINESALVPMNEVFGMLERISSSNNNPVTKAEEGVKVVIADLKKTYFAPKIGSGVFGAIAGYIFLNPEKLLEHPLILAFFNTRAKEIPIYISTQISMMTISALILSICFFILTWNYEKKLAHYSKIINSDSFLHEIYQLIN